MKPQLLDELKKQYSSVHGCYRPEGGPCFYLASNPAARDFGRRTGRRFVAAVEARNGTLDEKVSLTFLVATMAQMVKSDLIGDLDTFCEEVGLERLRETLSRDFTSERDEEIVLTRDSDDSLFRRPSSTSVIQQYQVLKGKILHVLADRHARGAKRVPASVVLDALCADPWLINRALNELVESQLIRDLNHSDGMQLTAQGQKEAEGALASRETGKVTKPVSSHFDFFISYASEDRGVAETLDKSLSARGYKVWRDRGQLTLGDSLTAKINEGLAASRFGIVIISSAFLRKNWPQAELNALQARAIVEGKKVILPIRRDLNHEEMAKHLPLLGDKVTIAVTDNLDEVVSEIECAVGSPK
jgi:hypothetical protein